MRLLIVAALLMIGGAAHGVPVVPSFSQGSMTSRTETRSSVTEGDQLDGLFHWLFMERQWS